MVLTNKFLQLDCVFADSLTRLGELDVEQKENCYWNKTANFCYNNMKHKVTVVQNYLLIVFWQTNIVHLLPAKQCVSCSGLKCKYDTTSCLQSAYNRAVKSSTCTTAQ